MDRSDVQRWLDDYLTAWRLNQAEPIKALFTEGAVYRNQPYGGDARAELGRAAIAAEWLEQPDQPDSWEAAYEVYAVDGDRAVAVGYSRYLATDDGPERTFHNCFLLRFASDGRCAELTEYYMEEQPADS
ncbi:MAG: nuclear transport factor 2 family protein [Acidimicrobiia bacterium]